MWTTYTKMHVILVNMNPGNGFVTFKINRDIDICDVTQGLHFLSGQTS